MLRGGISNQEQARILSRDSDWKVLKFSVQSKRNRTSDRNRTDVSRSSGCIFNEKVDLIQIGARNMQNFDLLKQLGQLDRPDSFKTRPECDLKSGSCPQNTSWPPEMRMSSSANAESVLLKLIPETGSAEHPCSEKKTPSGHHRSEPRRRKMVAGRTNGKASVAGADGLMIRSTERSGMRTL